MASSFYEFLDIIDIISSKPEIKVKGKSRFVTTFGKVISFSCILVIMVLSIFIMIDVIKRKSLSIIYNLDNRETPSIKINESQIALLLIDALGNEITEHDRYFNFMVKFWKIEVPKSYSQNTTDFRQTYLPTTTNRDLPLRNCSSLHYSKFSDYYESYSKLYDSGVCIDFSNTTDPLFGKYGDVEGFSFMHIYIQKCLNSTILDKTNCFPEEIIDKKLSQVFFNLLIIENDVDSNNYTNPISEFYKNEMLQLSSTVYKQYFIDINSINFKSDNGFLFNDEKSYQSYRTDRIVESVDLRGKNTLFPGTFSQITFRCSGKTENFHRSYLKLTALVASIGGVMQVIVLIGKCLVYFYSKNSMLNYLIYQILNIEEVENVLKNNNKDRNQKRIQNSSIVKTSKFVNSSKNNNIENSPNEINLRNIKMNLISGNKDIDKNNLNEIDNYFYPINKVNNDLKIRKLEESRLNQDWHANQDLKEIGDNYSNASDKLGGNLKINKFNSSNDCILNKNAIDPNGLKQLYYQRGG